MVVEYQPERCIVGREALLIPPLECTGEGIDTSRVQININPEVFTRKEKPKPPVNNSLDIPIWESDHAEIYATSPGLTRFVIWEHKPDDEEVRKFNRFDDFDPLPHHYYASEEEYAQALRSYKAGKYPDKRIDLNGFFESYTEAPEVIVDFTDSKKDSEQREVKAA